MKLHIILKFKRKNLSSKNLKLDKISLNSELKHLQQLQFYAERYLILKFYPLLTLVWPPPSHLLRLLFGKQTNKPSIYFPIFSLNTKGISSVKSVFYPYDSSEKDKEESALHSYGKRKRNRELKNANERKEKMRSHTLTSVQKKLPETK